MMDGRKQAGTVPSFQEALERDPAAREYISRPWQERLPQWNRNCLPETEDATEEEIAVLRNLGLN